MSTKGQQQSNFDYINKEVKIGLDGNNTTVPNGFNRLNKYVGIRPRIYTTIIGSTGSGKTSLLHGAYILNPLDWMMSSENKAGIKLKYLLFSMERGKLYTLAKWVSRRIFLHYGVLITVPKLLGWTGRMTTTEHDLFILQKDYINEISEYVEIIEGAINPTGIYKKIKDYALSNGTLEKIDDYTSIYLPNNEKEIVLPVADHFSLTKPEKGMSKKEAIDKTSEYFQIARDLYGYSPIGVGQMNRDLSSAIYKNLQTFEPTLDNLKDSGRPAEDSDVVLSLFDPLRYKTADTNYNAEKFVNRENGANHFRNIKVLKNTYGIDQVSIGTAFQGAIGEFRELAKPKEMENFDYEQIFNGNYFLNK